MLKYDESLDGFLGSDDDDEKVNDDETKIVSIEELVDNAESDEDTEEPTAEDFCEEFIGS